jgi:hypothetical protein
LFHGAHKLVSAAVKVNGFCMREAGFLPFEAISEITGNPSPQKPFYPINTLIVFLAALNVLIWGHNVVMIAGIIASMLVNAFSS